MGRFKLDKIKLRIRINGYIFLFFKNIYIFIKLSRYRIEVGLKGVEEGVKYNLNIMYEIFKEFIK